VWRKNGVNHPHIQAITQLVDSDATGTSAVLKKKLPSTPLAGWQEAIQ